MRDQPTACTSLVCSAGSCPGQMAVLLLAQRLAKHGQDGSGSRASLCTGQPGSLAGWLIDRRFARDSAE